MKPILLPIIAVIAALPASHVGAQSTVRQSIDFVNLESPQVHPMDLNGAGTRLALCNTAAGRVEIFTLGRTSLPEHQSSIFTGLEPVSVRFRTNAELWVVSHVSDSIAVADVATGVIKRMIKTLDEPCDVVFAGDPVKAYITCSQVNKVMVVDADDPHAGAEEIEVEGEDPRALAVSRW